MAKPKALLLADAERQDLVFGSGFIAAYKEVVDLVDGRGAMEDPSLLPGMLKDTEIVVSTWGMPTLTPELLAGAPDLKAVFYAAGTVKYFLTDAVWDRDMVIVSAWAANAVPVAEFAVAQIVLALKNYWNNVGLSREARTFRKAPLYGCFGKRVGLIGIGMIGTLVAQMLKAYSVEVVVHDPFLPDAKAAELGVAKVGLDELFATSHVVCLHAPKIPATRHMITKGLIASMLPDAYFINTSRGELVDEEGMITALRERLDITALLDVTDPLEPPPSDSPLWDMPNIVVSPHIAGSMNDECKRMAEYCLDELKRYLNGGPLRYRVTRDMLATMA